MASFAEALYRMPTDRLRALVKLREVDPKRLSLMPDKRQLAQFLAVEFSKPPSVSRAILQCNARQLRLMQLMLSLDTRQTIPWRSVLEAAGGAKMEKALSAILSELEDLGLAFRVGDNVLLLDSVRHQVPASMSDRYTLARCLQSYDAPTVNRICSRLDLPAGTKSESIERIIRSLIKHPDGVHLNTPLNETETDALNYVIQSGGAATAIEVASAVLNNTDDFFRYDWQNRWKSGKEKNAIDSLLARGLLYVVSYSYGFNLYLVMPGDLLRAITGEADMRFWISPPPAPEKLRVPPPVVTRQTGLIRDVVALLGFLSTQEAVRTSTGYIHKTSLKNLARNLSLPNERYAAFLYAICREAGLISPSSEKMVYGITDKARNWLREGALSQARSLFDAWRKGDLWGEMYTEPLKRGNEYRQKEAVVSVRNAAHRLLVSSGAEAFIDVDSLTDALAFHNPMLLAQSAQIGGDLVPSPATFMRLLIGECLYWLGLVELGWNAAPPTAGEPDAATKTRGRPSNLIVRGEVEQKAQPPDAAAYHLTPLGAFLLGIPGAPAPAEIPAEDKFIVQANAEIFVPPFLEPSTLFHLLMITDVPAKGATGNVVTLTRESIRRALDYGLTGKELIEFLTAHGRTGIPQNVEYLINEVGGKHGHIHIGRAKMYVQVDSPLVLKELEARRELKGYFVRALSDTVAILNADDPDKLLRELRKAGYLPISDDAPKSRALQMDKKSAAAPRTLSSAASSNEGKPRVDVDTALNWERIAQEDTRLWSDATAPNLTLTRPDSAVRDKGNIRTLLVEAARICKRVQISYQGQTDATPQMRLIEPTRIMGNFVVAYLPAESEEATLNINRIHWAWATDESFDRG